MAEVRPRAFRSADRFTAKYQNKNADRKTTSTAHENGGQAITTIVSANQTETFRNRKSHRRSSRGEIAIATKIIAAPG